MMQQDDALSGSLSGLQFDLFDALKPDPLLPDLTDYVLPLSIPPFTSDLLVSSPLPSPDLLMSAQLAHDPLLPDLYPEGPDVVWPTVERPGDLADAAQDLLQQDPTYQQLAHHNYRTSFMDQSGVNGYRARHFDLLFQGLAEEERR
ncbi:glycosyltransferase family 1 protein [Tengunoibacter tsumagoiensis]|uniref:Uncharacterized protein n=1 Tax=Tengunoibacter tsumagoiensis TaxID=2014871 RepID=A0A402A2M2_9CHLR|nr:glycosyltransferase family 1 protein [Tengunoibacter tsumagoiensis]GCE13306.1 hypothetical protein KTT_31650 [Tengunoibacter tsumagoiensis]